MVVLIKTLQVILALSILILIHELGHFTFARIFGIRVDKFYLFFDIGGKALFRYKPKNSHTEYGIGWLPLGGYCKIAGMVDESLDTGSLKNPPQPWEMRSKPAWQRLFVMLGGVLFNFIFAVVVFIAIMAVWGQSYVDNGDDACLYVNELAYEMGFRNGDHIVAMDGVPQEDFAMMQVNMVRNDVSKVTVLRDGDTLNLYIDKSRTAEMLNTPGMFSLALPFVIDSIPPVSVNHEAGLMKGDRIVEVDSVAVSFLQDARPLLAGHAGGRVHAMVVRGADTLTKELAVDTLGRIGVITKAPSLKTRTYSLWSAVPAGITYTFDSISGYVKDLGLMFRPQTGAYKSVGSFIAIGQVFPASWNWYAFMTILAMLSIMLGVMNLLPIPALDGGHAFIIIYEMITGRKPGDRAMVVLQVVGMIFIFALMILALGNDIIRLLS